MDTLHVWGHNNEVSVVSPECLASVWIVGYTKEEIKIVSSCNTNLSKTGKLPVLVIDDDPNHTVEGFEDIYRYICANYTMESEIITFESLDTPSKLLDKTLLHFCTSKLHYIHQFNIYINRKNYEEYVRKLFKNYLPFPMMYNQPLKYYQQAQQEVKVIGIGENKKGFLFQKEDELEDDNTVPISKLHEKQLLLKNKEKMTMRETRNILKIIALLDSYLTQWEAVHIKHQDKISCSEVLFLAYISSLRHLELPDKTVGESIKMHSALSEWSQKWINKLQEEEEDIHKPTGREIPSLFNEVKYQLGI